MQHRCSLCKQEKEFSEFTRDSSKKIGRTSRCKSCINSTKKSIKVVCQICFSNTKSSNSSCCFTCSVENRKGLNHPRWKGGRSKNKDGYIKLWDPDNPNSDVTGYVLEHRKVMSIKLNRPLENYELVHHKNGIRTDNTLENLELCIKSQPPSQRVDDLVSWATEILSKYKPELLR